MRATPLVHAHSAPTPQNVRHPSPVPPANRACLSLTALRRFSWRLCHHLRHPVFHRTSQCVDVLRAPLEYICNLLSPRVCEMFFVTRDSSALTTHILTIRVLSASARFGHLIQTTQYTRQRGGRQIYRHPSDKPFQWSYGSCQLRRLLAHHGWALPARW
ncbi:hypothetical protein HYPSUDRAFT_914020 [Hypholoma sublateritium FD-334 SS-4]|uniref:Uncharacterized protein n=1 Tax=Hypholoma sublateritium (strain FD-334 SS-4) TaxID=945553 RepID=A0A0D2M6L9_HYPSF|nr:hypothetical protein HYPSUDRAFT_914020 [Hypholoma sublateritium FD-334 SS-4]